MLLFDGSCLGVVQQLIGVVLNAGSLEG